MYRNLGLEFEVQIQHAVYLFGDTEQTVFKLYQASCDGVGIHSLIKMTAQV
jgi:hypothetical protein